jgi:hypothetical protein
MNAIHQVSILGPMMKERLNREELPKRMYQLVLNRLLK